MAHSLLKVSQFSTNLTRTLATAAAAPNRNPDVKYTKVLGFFSSGKNSFISLN